jgi:hypothetical protein
MLVDAAVEEITEVLDVAAEAPAVSSMSAAAPGRAQNNRHAAIELLASSSPLCDLLALARRLHLQDSSEDPDAASTTAELHGFPLSIFFLVPFIALLSSAEAQQILTLLLRSGSPTALQTTLSRVVRTPGVSAQLAAVDLGVYLISQNDIVMARADFTAIAKVVTDTMFEDVANRMDVFTSSVITEMLSKLVNAAIAKAQPQLRDRGASADTTVGVSGSANSKLLMRALLHCQKKHPDLRGKLRGLLSSLLLRAGAAALDPITQVRAWAIGGSSGASTPSAVQGEEVASSAGPQLSAAASSAVAQPGLWVPLLHFVKGDPPYALEILTHLPKGFLSVLLTASPREAVLRDRFVLWFQTWSDRSKAPAHVHELVKSLSPPTAAAPAVAASSNATTVNKTL